MQGSLSRGFWRWKSRWGHSKVWMNHGGAIIRKPPTRSRNSYDILLRSAAIQAENTAVAARHWQPEGTEGDRWWMDDLSQAISRWHSRQREMMSEAVVDVETHQQLAGRSEILISGGRDGASLALLLPSRWAGASSPRWEAWSSLPVSGSTLPPADIPPR